MYIYISLLNPNPENKERHCTPPVGSNMLSSLPIPPMLATAVALPVDKQQTDRKQTKAATQIMRVCKLCYCQLLV